MGNKQDYKLRNKRFLQEIKKKEGILALADGVMADIIKKGEGSISPSARSIVTCKYKGSLITGEVFDSNWENEYPEAFRVNELIEGFQIGIQAMHQGDIFRIYIP
ncbi:MAG: FKBP-type peptidyl-prolyl cis-trans isomerase, partial [Prevotella bivia]|nr:FKBP-type peptidyl-prolyl cis-trans isomerase [Prevotella bivia]